MCPRYHPRGCWGRWGCPTATWVSPLGQAGCHHPHHPSRSSGPETALNPTAAPGPWSAGTAGQSCGRHPGTPVHGCQLQAADSRCQTQWARPGSCPAQTRCPAAVAGFAGQPLGQPCRTPFQSPWAPGWTRAACACVPPTQRLPQQQSQQTQQRCPQRCQLWVLWSREGHRQGWDAQQHQARPQIGTQRRQGRPQTGGWRSQGTAQRGPPPLGNLGR